MDVAGARVLITGGAGLVGSHLADLLIDHQVEEVVVLDNLSLGRPENLVRARNRGRVTLLVEDVRNVAAVRTAMKGIDLVFHQAALGVAQCVEQPRAAVEVLIEGTFNILDASVRAGVQKVVAASTACVYGEASYVPIDELHPYNNHTLYGACKIASEQLLRVYYEMHGLPFVALRYFHVYGPRMDVYGSDTGMIIRWIKQIDAGQRPVIFGDGTQSADYVYVRDVAWANLVAMESAAADVFNVATGHATSHLELAVSLLHLLGRDDLNPAYQPERREPAARRWQGDIRKAQEVLGFSAQVGLLEGLRELLAWWTSARSVA